MTGDHQQAGHGRLGGEPPPAGRLVRTNSPYVDGNTVTLFDLDLDALLKNDSAFARLQAAKTKEEMAEVQPAPALAPADW